MTSEGLILLKPDGAASAAVRARLSDCLDRHGLHVARRRGLRFRPTDIVAIWPMFGSDAHPVMGALYRQYMTGGESEALLLRGADALAGGLAVKGEMRRAFEVCAFENALHAPADAQELAANVGFLFEGMVQAPDAAWPEWSKQGRFGRAALVSLDAIEALAAAIWGDRMAGGWQAVHRDAASNAPWRAVLRPGDPNSIDYGLSVLFEALGEQTFETCVRRYITAEVFGGCVVAEGSLAAMTQLQRGIAAHRMTVELQPR